MNTSSRRTLTRGISITISFFCAVNFVDHHKYVSNKRTYYGIRNISDRLCRENGLSVVVPEKGSKGKKLCRVPQGEIRKSKTKDCH